MNAAEVEEGGPLAGKQAHAKGLALALRRGQGLLRRPHTCMLFALASLSEHVSAYHMAFKRPKVDRGGGGKGGDHLSAIINGTRRQRVALLRGSLPPPPYGRSFVLRNGRVFLRGDA